jgi:7,8-dihydropterin-6-yl-methyl-4-(beta-D-ribofuranosyl)aminobenzene 5'-phosphate synthase
MKARYLVLLIINLIVWIQCFGQKIESDGKDVFLTILYDNKSVHDSIITDNGFSCLIELDGTNCLFDAGRVSGKLILNMDRLKVSYSDIKHVYISHIHDDHMGGLQDILAKCNKPVLYMPFSYPQLINEPPSDRADSDWQALLDQYKPLVSELIREQEPTNVGDICYSTGAIEKVFYEQSLIITTSKGLVILTGCSHPGIVEIVKHAKQLMTQDIYLVLGGFHLGSTDLDEVKNIAQDLRKLTKFIGPCHCTGEDAMEVFQNVFKEDYIDIKAGLKINIDNGLQE